MVTVEQFLNIANEMNASDVHLTAGISPMARVDGELVKMNYPELQASDVEKIVLGIMNDTQLKIFQKAGEMDFAFSIPNVGRYRVNAFHQRGCVACAIRVIKFQIPRPEDLGIPQSVIDLCRKKRGLVLVTGPTGSGKTTTLASLIGRINNEQNAHIITLESPVEYLHSHGKSLVNQREVGIDTPSYSTALCAALREDPDVILVGEMKDPETISEVITAAETGHLVFATLHTMGAEASVDYMIEAFPPHQQQQTRVRLGRALEAVISQQLIPRMDKKGLVAAYEVMHANAQIKNLVREAKTSQISTVIQTNKDAGMAMMDDALIGLCRSGAISPESAIDYAQDMTYVENEIAGCL